jgi:hypothetical protein
MAPNGPPTIFLRLTMHPYNNIALALKRREQKKQQGGVRLSNIMTSSHQLVQASLSAMYHVLALVRRNGALKKKMLSSMTFHYAHWARFEVE